jgi:hypothetical protein
MRNLDQMVESLHHHARKQLIGSSTAQLLPLFHIQFRNRPDAIMAAPWRDEREKAAMIYSLKRAMKEFRGEVVNYGFMAEAWAAAQSHEPRIDDLQPSQREDRREIVMISVGDFERAFLKAFEIVRDDKGRVTDLLENEMPDEFGGRLFNLLADDDE